MAMNHSGSMPAADLKPRGVITILASAISLFTKRFHVLIMLSLLADLPVFLLDIALGVSPSAIRSNPVALLIKLPVIFVMGCIFQAAATIVCSHHLLGLKASYRQIFSQLRGALILRIAGTSLLLQMITAFLLCLLIVPGVLYVVNRALSIPIVVLERRAYRDALLRSKILMRGNFWRFLGLVWAQVILVVIALLLIGTVIDLAFPGDNAIKDLHVLYQISISFIIPSLVLVPLVFIPPVLFYYDVRIRKEGLSVEAIRELN